MRTRSLKAGWKNSWSRSTSFITSGTNKKTLTERNGRTLLSSLKHSQEQNSLIQLQTVGLGLGAGGTGSAGAGGSGGGG